jgi:hypothetical protein
VARSATNGRDHRAAARRDNDDAAAADTASRWGVGPQLERAEYLVDHNPRLELGELRANTSPHAAAER